MIFITRGEIKTETGYLGKGATVNLAPEEERRLIAAGRAQPLFPSDTTEGDLETSSDPAPNAESTQLEKMSLTELRAYAQKKGIDLKGAKDKTDVLEAIKMAETHE